MKEQLGKVIITVTGYPFDEKELMEANLAIMVWPESGEYRYPYFLILKNRWGVADEKLQIPLMFLPKVLENPSGKLDWI
jgi:hypothetical protein